MKSFLAFVKKEFLHIFRDLRTLVILLLMPVVLVLLFGFALGTDISDAQTAVFNPSNDPLSRRITERFEASEYFKVVYEANSTAEVDTLLRRGEVKFAVIFPDNLERDLLSSKTAQIRLIADASDPNESTSLTSYARAIILQESAETYGVDAALPKIIPEAVFLYNPQLKSAYNFVPGVMGLILFLVCTLMTSVGIVREKELGTMEILLVSPLRPAYVILAKAIPYFLISAVIVCVILLLARFALEVPIRGSIPLLFALSGVYTVLGLILGIFVSTVANTQQSAIMLSALLMILTIMLLSGMVFPVENMPKILQVLSNIVPAKWYISGVKDIMLKGVGMEIIWKDFAVLCGMIAAAAALSVAKFKTRLE